MAGGGLGSSLVLSGFRHLDNPLPFIQDPLERVIRRLHFSSLLFIEFPITNQSNPFFHIYIIVAYACFCVHHLFKTAYLSIELEL